MASESIETPLGSYRAEPRESFQSVASPASIELAVVIPTFNEVGNIEQVVDAVRVALAGHSFEVIVVDDNSPDGTADRVREIARRDVRVRCLHRIGRRGLASAVVEGALATAAPLVAVIDADMQHDESMLPAMLSVLSSPELDLVVASRYLGNDARNLANAARGSRLATALAKRLTKVEISDPMSGFFMIRSEALRRSAPNLSAIGFKILLDILLSSPKPLRVAELSYQFRERAAGSSKRDAKVLLEFTELLVDHLVGRIVPAKFVLFALVGSFGVIVHLLVLAAMFRGLKLDFPSSQGVAALAAMTSNFVLNNVFTYHDRRLTGWRWLTGWLSFALASSVGMLANIGVATYLFTAHAATWLPSAVAGILVGVVWNYTVTSLFTWRR